MSNHRFNKNCDLCGGPIRSWEKNFGIGTKPDKERYAHNDCVSEAIDTERSKTHVNKGVQKHHRRLLDKNEHCHFCGGIIYCDRTVIFIEGETSRFLKPVHRSCIR